jgi:hypothetical protein
MKKTPKNGSLEVGIVKFKNRRGERLILPSGF